MEIYDSKTVLRRRRGRAFLWEKEVEASYEQVDVVQAENRRPEFRDAKAWGWRLS